VVLVDTGVWIDWLRQVPSPQTTALGALLDDGDACLAPVIFQELLQGARTPAALQTLRRRFGALPMLLGSDPTHTHRRAGELYARARWQGITPRSPHDCLIVATAVEHRVPLLHGDRDFDALARIEPALTLFRPPADP
jgi:predicted nucleic acid-binding protein